MNLKQFFKPVIIAACGLALTAGASLAAQSTASLNVRSGPNTSYRVVDVLFPGQHVNVQDCRNNGWCFVSHRGANGWVSSRYLTNDGYVGPRYRRSHVAPVLPRIRTYPRQNNGITIQFGTNGFGFSVNPPRQPHKECFRRHGKRVCHWVR